MAETIKQQFYKTKFLINKFLNFIIIDLFFKNRNGRVVENLFPDKMIRDLLESNHFLKFGSKQ